MKIGRMRLWWRWWRMWCRSLYVVLYHGQVYHTRRVPIEGGVLLLANHQSFFDPVLATLALPREASFVARDTLFRSRPFGWLIRSLNAFPVRRGTADRRAIKEIIRQLKAGQAVVLFPEATRTRDGRINTFQHGVVMVARRAAVPIIPVLIDGAFDAWPRSRTLPTIGKKIRVEYGHPLPPEQIKSVTAEEAVNLVHRQLIQMQNALRRRLALPLHHEQ